MRQGLRLSRRLWLRHRVGLAGVLLMLASGLPEANGSARAEDKPDTIRLPERVNIRLLRPLERELSNVERALVEEAKIEKERVRNVTMPLQNYLDDVVLASGRSTDIYPQVIYEVLIEELSSTKPRTQIANLLIDYQKKGQFKARAEARESRSPKKGKAGS